MLLLERKSEPRVESNSSVASALDAQLQKAEGYCCSAQGVPLPITLALFIPLFVCTLLAARASDKKFGGREHPWFVTVVLECNVNDPLASCEVKEGVGKLWLHQIFLNYLF